MKKECKEKTHTIQLIHTTQPSPLSLRPLSHAVSLRFSHTTQIKKEGGCRNKERRLKKEWRERERTQSCAHSHHTIITTLTQTPFAHCFTPLFTHSMPK